MKRFAAAALAACTALGALAQAGGAAAQPGWRDGDHGGHHDRGPEHGDRGREPGDRGPDHGDWGREHGDRGPDHGDWGREHHDRGPDRRDWGGDHGPRHWRYYGNQHGYSGYRGHWRTGQRYPYWRDNRYVVQDWRGYGLPPPRPGYRYYRDDNGDVVMVAIASGLIGLIVGGALN